MKKFWTLAFVPVLLLLLFAPCKIAAAEVRVIDSFGLFTPSEQEALEEKAQRISDEYDTNIIILAADESGFSDNYARDLIEGYGEEAYPEGYIGYAINMADRSYWVDAFGDRLRGYFPQSKTDDIADEAYDRLSDGEYYGSADSFLNNIDKRLAIQTSKYGNLSKLWVYKGRTIFFGAGAVILALVAAGGWTLAKVHKHADKKTAQEAELYKNELRLSNRRDQFIRAYQTRIRKPESSSGGGHSSGGGSAGHTGSGGHF